MVAATQPRPTPKTTSPVATPLDRGDLLTIWTHDGRRHTGAYLGYHVDSLGAQLVLLESAGAPPLYIDWRNIKQAVRYSFGGKRHVGILPG